MKKPEILSDEELLAEVWDLNFGLTGIEGRAATKLENYQRIAQCQLDTCWEKTLESFYKEYLRATWLSVKKGAGDTAMPQQYLVFMIPTDEWRALQAQLEEDTDGDKSAKG